jgi:hypothetical protein
MLTVEQLISEVLTRLAMEEDISAPTYTYNRIRQALRHKYNKIFEEYWLPEYTVQQEEHVLNGTTGKIATTIPDCKRFSDIKHIFHEHYNHPLTMHNDTVRVGAYSSTQPLIVSDIEVGRLFKIIPAYTTGKVYVTYRKRIEAFIDDEIIPMDYELLVNGACFDILEDDGTNPGASDKFREFFMDRENQIRKSQFNIAPTHHPMMSYPTRWS